MQRDAARALYRGDTSKPRYKQGEKGTCVSLISQSVGILSPWERKQDQA